MIKQNPRDNLTAPSSSSSVSATVVETSTNNEDNLINNQDDSNTISQSNNKIDSDKGNRQKRKSPETALTEMKLSPDQKRSSGGGPGANKASFEDICIANGLPVDLNKLTKELLLEALEERGNTSFNKKDLKKTLKKDLIDALKAVLFESSVDNHNNNDIEEKKVEVQPIKIVENVMRISDGSDYSEGDSSSEKIENKDDNDISDNMELPTSPTVNPPSSSTSPSRKGSFLGEIRNIINNTFAPIPKKDESKDIRDKSIQEEFEARQRRHRDSKARQSDVSAVEIEPPKVTEEVSPNDVNITGQSPVINNTWMEVASPVRVTKDSNESNKVDEIVSTESVNMDFVTSPSIKEAPSQTNITSPTTESSGATEMVMSPEIAKSLENTISDVDSTTSTSSSQGVDSVAPVIKKPLNLMGGTSSFLDKPAAAKPVVAALEKAKQAKAAEEAKKLLKAKELEKKKAAMASNAATVKPSGISTANAKPSGLPSKMPTSTQVTSKVPSQSSITTSVPTTTTSTSVAGSATSVPAPVKKGLLGLLAGKPKTPVAAEKSNPIAATSSSSSSLDFFDVNACVLTTPAPSVSTAASIIPTSASSAITKTVLSADKPQQPVQQSTQLEPVKEEIVESSPVPVVEEVKTVAPVDPIVAPVQNTVKPNFKVKVPVEDDDEPKENAVPPQKKEIATPGQNKVVDVKAQIPVATNVLKDITPVVVENVDEDDYDETEQYQIQDRDSGSDDSGTDDEAEEQDKQSKIPEWAKGTNLRDALERQYGTKNGRPDPSIIPMDPDLIFQEVQSCSLEEIFGAKEGRSGSYAKRTSSAHWDADKLTIIEKRTYRNHMGYDGL